MTSPTSQPMTLPTAVRTIRQVVESLPRPAVGELTVPPYWRQDTGLLPDPGPRLGLAVASMRDHMTDEGWQLFAGLETSGYTLAGRGLPLDETSVPVLLARTPSTVVLQDKREWDPAPGDFRDPGARFTGV